MVDDRRRREGIGTPGHDPGIVVFGVDEGWDSGPSPSPSPLVRGAASYPGATSGAVKDEITQGDARPSAARFSRWFRLGPDRSPGRVQLAAGVVVLTVIAFLAGVLVGRGGGSLSSTARVSGASSGPLSVPRSGYATFPTPAPPVPSASGPNLGPLPSGTTGPRVDVGASSVFALELGGRSANPARHNLELRDSLAAKGPWSLIVRRSDGSLGRHSAVVTFPLPAQNYGRTVAVGAVVGRADGTTGIVWPLAGRFARIRGDLGLTQLAALAVRVRAHAGRPVLTSPPPNFHVAASELYRAPVVTQGRYSNSLALPSGPIDGLIFTGLVHAASFEDALYVEAAYPAGVIGGHRAVLSSVAGGNGSLAWEIAAGVVVFVAYSSGLILYSAAPTLIDLARGGRLIDAAQWRAERPTIVATANVYT